MQQAGHAGRPGHDVPGAFGQGRPDAGSHHRGPPRGHGLRVHGEPRLNDALFFSAGPLICAQGNERALGVTVCHGPYPFFPGKFEPPIVTCLALVHRFVRMVRDSGYHVRQARQRDTGIANSNLVDVH